MQNSASALSLRHFRAILAIADTGNLIGAARVLNLSQPAITKALQEAEAIIGAPIFERTSRGARPTIFGDALIGHGRIILSQLAHAGEEVDDLRDGLGGQVVIGGLAAATVELLPLAIAKLRADRPRLSVSVIEATNDRLIPLLRGGELDFLVGRLSRARDLEGLAQEALFHDIACVVAGPDHPLRSAPTLTLGDLLDERWILPTSGSTLRGPVEAAFLAEGLEPPRHAVESVALLTNSLLIRDHGYIAFYPWPIAQREAALGQISILPIALDATDAMIGVTTRRGARLSPAAQDAIACIRAVAKAIGVPGAARQDRSPFSSD